MNKEKSIEEIQTGDILKLKKDNLNYELKSISYDKSEKEYFSFFGFVIKERKNLKKHFHNIHGKFQIEQEITFDCGKF